MRLRNAYLIAENRILRQQITGRVPLTDGARKTLAELGQQLGKQALAEIATVARPDTILAWHRACADQPYDSSQPQKSVGRPRIDKELEDLVVRMARENRSWGYDRIVGALSNLGYRISDQTVGNVLKRQGIPPAPERKKTVTWREFVRIHMAVLSATDFLTSAVWLWCGLVIALRRFFMSCGRGQGKVPLLLPPLQQLLIRGIHAWSHKVKVHVQRWQRLVEEMMWVRPRGGAHGVRWAPSHEVLLYACQELSLHNRGKVVSLRTACPRLVRDGPLRRQCRRGGRQADEAREAA